MYKEHVKDIHCVFSFDDLDEKEIYEKLDILLQFMIKNKLNGNINLCIRDINTPDEDDD